MLIIFAECGILLGFFLPGDTLLFVSGLFIATGAHRHQPVVVHRAGLAGRLRRQHGRLRHRLEDRAAGVQPAECQVPQARVHREVRGVLRQVRQDHHRAGPVRAGGAHGGHRDGRRVQDEPEDLHAVLGDRRRAVGRRRDHRRLLPRPDRLHREERRPDRGRRGRHRGAVQRRPGDRALGAPPPPGPRRPATPRTDHRVRQPNVRSPSSPPASRPAPGRLRRGRTRTSGSDTRSRRTSSSSRRSRPSRCSRSR